VQIDHDSRRAESEAAARTSQAMSPAREDDMANVTVYTNIG